MIEILSSCRPQPTPHNNQQHHDDDDHDDNEEEEAKNNVSLEFTESSLEAEEIRYNVREQWRKIGRDPDCLMAGMGKTKSGRFVNALLVTNNETASTKSNDEELNLKLSTSLEGDYDPKCTYFIENASFFTKRLIVSKRILL